MEIAAWDSFHNCEHHRPLPDEANGNQVPSPTLRGISLVYRLQVPRNLPTSAEWPSSYDLKRIHKRPSIGNGGVSSLSAWIRFHFCYTVELPRNLHVRTRSNRSPDRALQSFPPRSVPDKAFVAKVQALMSRFGLFGGNLEKTGTNWPLLPSGSWTGNSSTRSTDQKWVSWVISGGVWMCTRAWAVCTSCHANRCSEFHPLQVRQSINGCDSSSDWSRCCCPKPKALLIQAWLQMN
jgi:hypothetical protein